MTAPTSASTASISPVDSDARQPGIDSSLSSVPPVCPSPRPDSCGTYAPQAATSGASGRVILSPTPPVECLSAVGRSRTDQSIRSPESIIAAVQSAISRRVMPLSRIAMANAAICSSATSPRVYAPIIQEICSRDSSPPSRLVTMTSMASISRSPAQIVRAEGVRQQLRQRLGAVHGLHEQVGTAVFVQQLTAAPARHQQLLMPVDAGEGDQPSPAGGVQRRHQPALGAQADTVGGVLYIASRHDPAVVDERGGADGELGVG